MKGQSWRVFVVYRSRLFAEVVALMLTREGIEVVGMDGDWEKGMEAAMELTPDAVVTDMDLDEPRITDFLVRVAGHLPDVKLICCSMDTNEVDVYSKHRTTVLGRADLVSAIQVA